mmetsp:Transcript_10118/g.20172  ORF Transcript_10118/g.20172 Transcript_10118/m.20172 type:complete len:326 (-) Transcript_10118:250-1227(-)
MPVLPAAEDGTTDADEDGVEEIILALLLLLLPPPKPLAAFPSVIDVAADATATAAAAPAFEAAAGDGGSSRALLAPAPPALLPVLLPPLRDGVDLDGVRGGVRGVDDVVLDPLAVVVLGVRGGVPLASVLLMPDDAADVLDGDLGVAGDLFLPPFGVPFGVPFDVLPPPPLPPMPPRGGEVSDLSGGGCCWLWIFSAARRAVFRLGVDRVGDGVVVVVAPLPPPVAAPLPPPPLAAAAPGEWEGDWVILARLDDPGDDGVVVLLAMAVLLVLLSEDSNSAPAVAEEAAGRFFLVAEPGIFYFLFTLSCRLPSLPPLRCTAGGDVS